jgi:hypothetical protein
MIIIITLLSLRHRQFYTQWVPGILCLRQSGRGVKLTTRLMQWYFTYLRSYHVYEYINYYITRQAAPPLEDCRLLGCDGAIVSVDLAASIFRTVVRSDGGSRLGNIYHATQNL